MKAYSSKIALAIIILFISCSKNQKPKQRTAEEYKQASRLMDRGLSNLIYNQVSGSTFIGQKHLVYATKTKNGKKFILVDIAAKSKKEAFNHNKLAKSLSEELDQKIEKNNLPIYQVSLSKDLKTAKFTLNRQRYSCNLENYSISKVTSQNAEVTRNEHVSPNGNLAAYIDNYNLWIRDLITNKKNTTYI